MNLVVLLPEDLHSTEEAEISGRRAEHILKVLGAGVGDRVAVGLLDGPRGSGEVLEVRGATVRLGLALDPTPPPRPRTTVVLAMVRPQIMKRTLQHLATLGARRILLVGAQRVEKAYFSQRLFDGDEWREQLLLGLEQARDTWLPELSISRRFRPFVEDVLPGLIAGASLKLVAHPGASEPCPLASPGEEVALAIGPEGGWVDYEVEQLSGLGFAPVSLGERILKVETAIPYLYGALRL